VKKKWLMFWILYVAALIVPLSQLKIPPVMGMVAEAFGISVAQASWLMSVFTLAGIILAIPGAAILSKIGSKKLLIVLMAALLVGNVLGAVTTSYTALLVSRAIEGIAYAMIITVGLVMINAWFSQEEVGVPVGIFNTFVPLGAFVALNAAFPIAKMMGLKSLWLILAFISAIWMLVIAVVLKVPDVQGNGAKAEPVFASFIEALGNIKTWILAFAMWCLAFVLFAYITAYPHLYGTFYGLEPKQANFYSSLNGLFGIAATIITGVLINKTRKPATLALIGFLLLIPVALITTSLSGPFMYALHPLLTALFIGFVITAIFCLAPILAKQPKLIGYTVAFVNFMYYIGVFASTPVILSVAETAGWPDAKNVIALIAVVGTALIAILTYLLKPSNAETAQ